MKQKLNNADFLAEKTNLLKNILTLHLEKVQPIFFALKNFTSKNFSEKEFLDTLSQISTYSLFLAKQNAENQEVNLQNFQKFLSPFFLISEIFNIFSNLNNAEINQIFSEILEKNFETQDELFFYEYFLKSYNQKIRKEKGVFYTPPQVVNFIVRATNQVLKQHFYLKNGLADKVKIVDFSTGTGNFILEILKQHQCAENILNNIFAFEFLPTPFLITFIKISQLLTKFKIYSQNHFNIFLENFLEKKYLSFLDSESIPVFIGNPPYSAHSKNRNSFIIKLLEYYKTDLKERNILPLHDDYVKFIRLIHEHILEKNYGIIAIITNNVFLDGLVHRKMREKILQDFDKIFILNLHGNALRGEMDKNIFNIRLGVTISIFVKLREKSEQEIFYFSTKEKNLNSLSEKLNFLEKNSLETVNFKRIAPKNPHFLFIDQENKTKKKNLEMWKLSEIFTIFSVGMETKIDNVAVDFDKKELKNRIKNILESNISRDEMLKKFNISEKTTWEHKRAMRSIFNEKKIVECNYRPFDMRFTYYDYQFLSRSRKKVMDNFFEKENIGLISTRSFRTQTFNNVFVTNKIAERGFLGISYVFPLYIYRKN